MSHRWGTDIRRGIDTKALSEALARPGTDLRYWVSHGTVGVQDDAGNFDVQNPNSIWIGPEGVECDVRLEPLMIHVCCRFAGISGGDVTAYPPIHPGDQVLVTLPEGFAHLPVIVAVMNSRACKQPLDANQVPIFDNERLLIYAKTADIDIRTAGGVQLLMEQNGSVTTTATAIKQGSPAASEHAALGDQLTTQWQSLLSGLQSYADAIQSTADPTHTATVALTAVIGALQSQTFVSAKVTLE